MRFCPYCGISFHPSKDTTIAIEHPNEGAESSVEASATLIPGLAPEEKGIQFSVGPYQVLSSIGRGGMGEVFLAYDTICGRRLALKRIRPDLADHPQIHRRFMKEARITSQLTHPAIIPIYSIHGEQNLTYYTMPFVEGSTLKQILRKTRQEEKKGGKPESVGGSIPALTRTFLSICQAVAYAHSKSVLHRDLKPENIIVGRYGEVLILDWGLAKIMLANQPQELEEVSEHGENLENTSQSLHHITHIGKVVGTIPYMAPERALGYPANFQTDIYSLGVILYQILTLRVPFERGNLKEFRQNMHLERLHDPIEVAPYRDVPRLLAQCAMKCLHATPELRYRSVDELIRDLETYIEGRAEWFEVAELDIHEKSHWEFQENVLIAEHIAITRHTEVSDWVSLMISKASYGENLKIEADVRIGEKGQGIGFLLSIPEAAERVHLNDGYCLWLGSDLNKATKILRSTVEVMHAHDIFLQRHDWHHIRIEKMENKIHVYINDVLQLSYISHLPVTGTHIGLLSRDADFQIKGIKVSVGNLNVMINCLAVPDTFLAHRDFVTALSEYRRIGYSFPGRAEGREAMFRAGITILEQAKAQSDPASKMSFFDAALEEFEKLHSTPGAPLEYLGKALVYQAMNDYEEEIKCYELAYRRYPHHPLLPVLKEQIIYRMHESSRSNRKATFNFILLATRHIPDMLNSLNTKKLFTSLRKHWEPLPFFHEPSIAAEESIQNTAFAIRLAFWLAKPYVLIEIFEEQIKGGKPNPEIAGDAFYGLIELGGWKMARLKLDLISLNVKKEIFSLIKEPFDALHIALLSHEVSPEAAVEELIKNGKAPWNLDRLRSLFYILDNALRDEQTAVIHQTATLLKEESIGSTAKIRLDCYQIWAYLLDKNWSAAGTLLQNYSVEVIMEENNLLHFLYGIWLFVTENREIAQIHFSGVLEGSYPHTWMLFSHYFNGKIVEGQGWFLKAFMWEKRQLYRQLQLYYHCIGDQQLKQHFKQLEKLEFIHGG